MKSNLNSQVPPVQLAETRSSKTRRTSVAAHHHHNALRKPIKIALYTAWGVILAASMTLDSALDIFQQYYIGSHGQSAIPAPLLMIASGVLHCIAVAAMLLIGKLSRKHFLFFQPFTGGDTFVVMQAAGYMMVVIPLMVKAVILEQQQLRIGVFSVLGVFCLIGHLLLLTSLRFFKFSGSSTATTKNAQARGNLFQQVSPDVFWILLCCLLILMSSCVAEYRREYRGVSVTAVVVFVTGALASVQRRIAPRWLPNTPYIIFFPDASQSFSLFLLQGLANMLLLCGACGAVVLHQRGEEAPSSWHLGCGLFCILAVSIHTITLYQRKALAGDVQEKNSGSNSVTEPSPRASMIGPFFLTSMSTLVCICVFGTAAVLSLPTLHLDTNTVEGLRQVQLLLAAVMFVFPSLTHCLGAFLFDSQYKIWQPFGGNGEFVFLQSLGWAAYGIAVFFGTLHLSEETHLNFLFIMATALLLSQFLIHASISVFGKAKYVAPGPLQGTPGSTPAKDATAANVARSPSPPPSLSMTLSHDGVRASLASGAFEEEDDVSVLLNVLNGELFLAAALFVASTVVRIALDVSLFMHEKGSSGTAASFFGSFAVGTSTKTTGSVATFFSAAAVLMAQISMRSYVQVFSPQSHLYVCLMTLGWGVFILLLMRWSIVYTAQSDVKDWLTTQNGMLDLPNLLSPNTPSQGRAGTTLSPILRGVSTIEGFVFLFPLLCFVGAGLFENEASASAAKRRSRVRHAMLKVQGIVSTVAGDKDDVQKGEELDHLLRIIAGPRGVSAMEADGDLAEEKSSAALRDAARWITSILCTATTAAFVSGAAHSRTQPVMTLFFGAVGVALLSLSVCSLHFVYGKRLHGRELFSAFMPFAGGRRFVLSQTVGWISFVTVILMLVTCVVEGSTSPSGFVVMAALGVVSQVSLLYSVPSFDAQQKLQQTFVQQNAEGILTVVTVLAAFLVSRVYEMAHSGDTSRSLSSSLGPIVLCSLCVCFTLPMGLLSLQRQAEQYGLKDYVDWIAGTAVELSDSDIEDAETDDGEGGGDAIEAHHAGFSETTTPASTPWLPSEAGDFSRSVSTFAADSVGSPLLNLKTPTARRAANRPQRSVGRRFKYGAVVTYVIAAVLAIVLTVVTPLALCVGIFAYVRDAALTYDVAVRSLEGMTLVYASLVVIPMIVVPLVRSKHVLRNVHSAVCAFALYSIPTYTVVGGCVTPLIYACRGTWLFTVNMCVMSVLSTIPYVHATMFLVTMACFAYFIVFYTRYCFYEHSVPFSIVDFVLDMGTAVFWLWYSRRYVGRPEVTGRLYSPAATRMFQRYFFHGLCRYFSMKVIKAEGFLLPGEERFMSAPPAPVDLSNPDNQYVFSFHPHGIFPGTSMVVPKSHLWYKALGTNDKHIVTTHCADVIFSAPLMREFPLCLGAMSVSRRGIEGSLKNGNSPLIVTGGQSEMLLSRMSDTEMHLVCNHLGFLRMAMKNRVPLVPVISFAETNILDNVHCLPLQRWFLKRIGFPFPSLPMGRWWLPLPTAKPLTVIVGQPISPEPGRENPEDPECLDEFRLRYFEHLEVLFYRYRAAAGYPHMRLYMHNGIYAEGVLATPPLTEVEEAADAFQPDGSVNDESLLLKRQVSFGPTTPATPCGGVSAVRRAFAASRSSPTLPTGGSKRAPPAVADTAKKQ